VAKLHRVVQQLCTKVTQGLFPEHSSTSQNVIQLSCTTCCQTSLHDGPIKKRVTLLLFLSSPIIDRFSNFFSLARSLESHEGHRCSKCHSGPDYRLTYRNDSQSAIGGPLFLTVLDDFRREAGMRLSSCFVLQSNGLYHGSC